MGRRSVFLVIAVIILLGVHIGAFVWAAKEYSSVSEHEAVFEEVEPMLSGYERRLYEKFTDLKDWQRPDGPLKIGLQVGHWKNSELPDELERLRGTSTGASGGGKREVDVALVIAEKTADLLRAEGVEVDILPATVPESYWADLFIAIHADGNLNTSTRGFKAATPRRDLTDKADDFVDIFYTEYAKTTKLPIDPNITRNMRGYYAFNSLKYDHAIHPMTTAAILEVGFMSNAADRTIIIDQPELVAQGIRNAVMEYFSLQNETDAL